MQFHQFWSKLRSFNWPSGENVSGIRASLFLERSISISWGRPWKALFSIELMKLLDKSRILRLPRFAISKLSALMLVSWFPFKWSLIRAFVFLNQVPWMVLKTLLLSTSTWSFWSSWNVLYVIEKLGIWFWSSNKVSSVLSPRKASSLIALIPLVLRLRKVVLSRKERLNPSTELILPSVIIKAWVDTGAATTKEEKHSYISIYLHICNSHPLL